jgi:hypothetical protein
MQTVATNGSTFGESIDPEKPVRIVRENGFSAVVSDAMRSQYDASRANIGAHERIVRQAFDRGDVLPMRFGSVARDDQTVQSFLRDKHDVLEKSLAELHGRAELALKVLWDRDAVLREILTQNDEIRALRDAIRTRPEDETYDERVELGRLTSEALEQRRNDEVERILARLRPKAVAVDVKPGSETMVLNAAFLVDQRALEGFDEEVSTVSREMSDRLTFRYLGPLPPYSFVNIAVPKEG